MKTNIILKSWRLIALSMLCWTSLSAEGLKWLTDYKKAAAQAKNENKLLLMDFTGSDWCPPCKILHKQFFGAEEFKAFAKKNLVLLELDFPFHKELPPKLKEQNDSLAAKYKIGGYPTVIVLGKSDKILSKTEGLPRKGLAGFMDDLKKAKAKNG